MSSSYSPILTNLGINSDQADLYTSLLQNGPQTAIQLAQSTPVKRTYVYKLCEQLVSLGLIRQEIKGKTTTFIAENPDHLLEIAEDQKRLADTAAHSLENILPTLKSQFAAVDSKPVVTYYEGIEGIKKVYNDTLITGMPIDALVETSKVIPEIYEWVTKIYAPKRVKAGIRVKAIVASGSKTAEYTQKNEAELRETKIIDSNIFPFEHEVNIYGSKIAIINHNADDKPIGIIINNESIAATFRSWFELTWKLL